MTPRKVEDGFRILVAIDVSGELTDSECKLDLTKNEAIRKLGNSIEREIEDIANTGWQAVNRLNADLPGFAEKVHRKYPNEWKKIKGNWSEQFPKLIIDPQVRVSVIRIGLSHKPIKQDRSDIEG
ncbi:Ger(x)C family spore germination C-terminal domain-containing protein [Cohnella sp.]|uniref:Ger(x)C family spore germination C-terminal domain-containing protein n=1 Tax=Cohnella sp. TaxID=1883426 RepID=UPI0035632105